MKKVLLFLMFLGGLSLIADEDFDPIEHWKEMLEYSMEELEEMKSWKIEPVFKEITKKQIELKESLVKKLKEILEKDDVDFDGVELDIHLINIKMDLLHMESRILEIENREKKSEDDEEELKLLKDLLEIKKEIYKLQEREHEIRKKLSKFRNTRRIEELKRELEKLEGKK